MMYKKRLNVIRLGAEEERKIQGDSLPLLGGSLRRNLVGVAPFISYCLVYYLLKA
jgi:hypothetical protein